MSLTVKVYLGYLEKRGDGSEIRRFAVEEAATSYDYLTRKVSQVFSNLAKDFSLFWKDPDSDYVAFSSDDEMKEALSFVNEEILRVYIKEAAPGREGGVPLGPLGSLPPPLRRYLRQCWRDMNGEPDKCRGRMGKHCRKGEEETKENGDQENENSRGPSSDEAKVSPPESSRRCGMGGGRRWRGPMGGAGQCQEREGPHGGPHWVGITGQVGPWGRGPCPGRRGPLGGLGQCPPNTGKYEGHSQRPQGDGCRWWGPQGPWRRWAANQGKPETNEGPAPTDQDVQGEDLQQARKYMRQCWRRYWREMKGNPTQCKGKKGKMGKQGKKDEEKTEKDEIEKETSETTSGSSSDEAEVSPSEGRCGMRGGLGWWRAMGPACPWGLGPFPGRRGLFGGQGQCPGRAGPCRQTLGPHGPWRHWAATQGRPATDEAQEAPASDQAPTDKNVQIANPQQARKYMRQCWRQYWREVNAEKGKKGKMEKHSKNDEVIDGQEAAIEGGQAKDEASVEQDVNIELTDPSAEPAPYKEKTGAEEPTETKNTNKESDQSATESADREWTFVGRADPSGDAHGDPSGDPSAQPSVKTPEESAKPNTDTPSLYPKVSDASSKKHIADAIGHMKAMGFDDEGGWLTSLMTAKDGNISSALDAVHIGRKK